MKMDDISLSKAYGIWARSYKFDNRVYEIMQFIVKKENPKILMNRNPTLNYYSMLLMNVRKVKKDIDDFTLSVPLSVLPGLNADFDGDSGKSVPKKSILLQELLIINSNYYVKIYFNSRKSNV
jgi:hypothetical protein